MLVQLRVTCPRVHPVVRPTLLTVVFTARHPPVDEQSSAVMENYPTTVRLPLFAPLVLAMDPSAPLTLFMYLARAASL